MELKINEIENNNMYDTIPENIIPTKKVRFDEQKIKPIPKQQAKITRPVVQPEKPKISYDDILEKMGMFVSDGKLHLIDNLPKEQIKQIIHSGQQQNQSVQQSSQQNSYIYNKYFKNETTEYSNNIPKTQEEYNLMLIQQIINKHKINKIKSKKLIMPTSNINISYNNSDLNKLFNFSR
jgi:hypothetical protein